MHFSSRPRSVRIRNPRDDRELAHNQVSVISTRATEARPSSFLRGRSLTGRSRLGSRLQLAIVRAYSRACSVFANTWEQPAQLDSSRELATLVKDGSGVLPRLIPLREALALAASLCVFRAVSLDLRR
jgi:hypothetical protein